jgi:hypothetical protein
LNSKVKQVREVLGELQLPLEVIERALLKLAEFGGDVDRVADYAISLPNPLVPQECIEEHLPDVRRKASPSCSSPWVCGASYFTMVAGYVAGYGVQR